jgi:KDO2-lipid IV(A) lauroyltransferase
MKSVGYRLVYAFLWLLTLPPLKVLYLLSNALFVINYHIIKYRKNVVITNLKNAFPEKSDEEIETIAKGFYRHLSDFLIESIKSIHLNGRQLDKRMRYKNLELFHDLYREGKDVALISGHYGNWEWLLNLPQHIYHYPMTIYRPLKNNFSNQLISGLRSKGGMILVPMKKIIREAITKINEGHKIMVWYLGDQRPPKNSKFWTTFLNQETSFYQGAEKMAVKFNQAVVFMNIQKVKRGYYEANFHLLFKDGKNTSEFEITRKQAEFLEDIIIKRPEYWLWSHKRWKHKRPQNIDNA